MFRPIMVIEQQGAVVVGCSILFCLKHNYFHHGDRVQRNLDWASSHGLTHSIVNPLMSTRPNLLFARHAHSAVLKYATQSMTQKPNHTKHLHKDIHYIPLDT